MIHKPKTKTIYILAVGIILLATACSHSSEGEANTPTTFGTELVIPPTLVTIPEAELDIILEEIGTSDITGEGVREVIAAFRPNSPEANTFAIREAKRYQPFAIEFNQCFTSLDVFYDFENFVDSPIKRAIELFLRHRFEFAAITHWWQWFTAIDLSRGQIESVLSSGDEELPQAVAETLIGINEGIRRALSGILGDKSLQSLLDVYTYQTLPFLRQEFAKIGLDSSDAEISKFQDIWEENPKIEMSVRNSLRVIENIEINLLNMFEENNGLIPLDPSEIFLSLANNDENPVGLSVGEDYRAAVNFLLRSAAKQAAPAECINPRRLWFPDE